jgi:hypothetical protein
VTNFWLARAVAVAPHMMRLMVASSCGYKVSQWPAQFCL